MMKPVITQHGEGLYLNAFGNILSVMLNGQQTGGMLAVMSELTPPGGGPPLHMHSNEDEIFLVAEGCISYYVEDQWIAVGVGGSVFLPRGCAHCYRNTGTIPSRHWIITLPAGFEKFFANCASEFSRTSNPDVERIIEIHREHGIELIR
jgi:mannose-6-phosphate isomerase-like protein (cupin superfamily)